MGQANQAVVEIQDPPVAFLFFANRQQSAIHPQSVSAVETIQVPIASKWKHPEVSQTFPSRGRCRRFDIEGRPIVPGG